MTTCLLPMATFGQGFPQLIQYPSVELQKVGEGTFRWMLLKVYEGALYLDASALAEDPLADVAKCLELRYLVGISADDFRKSGNAILRKNVDETTWQSLQERLGRLNAVYRDVGRDDQYRLLYLPGEGTTLMLNEERLVTIEGADFAKAYFSIWLGENPVKGSFRNALMGS